MIRSTMVKATSRSTTKSWTPTLIRPSQVVAGGPAALPPLGAAADAAAGVAVSTARSSSIALLIFHGQPPQVSRWRTSVSLPDAIAAGPLRQAHLLDDGVKLLHQAGTPVHLGGRRRVQLQAPHGGRIRVRSGRERPQLAIVAAAAPRRPSEPTVLLLP